MGGDFYDRILKMPTEQVPYSTVSTLQQSYAIVVSFFNCVRVSPEEQHVAEQVCRWRLCSFGFWKKKVHLDYGLFWLFSFSPECSNPADMVQRVKITNQKIFRLNLLLYGHLYVVALLICAFVLMGKKKSINQCKNVM